MLETLSRMVAESSTRKIVFAMVSLLRCGAAGAGAALPLG
jgi:hypothetical protein